MARTIFSPNTRAYTRTFEYNRFKQKGLCRLCKKAINFGETIIGAGDRKRKYYHETCAKSNDHLRLIVKVEGTLL